MPEIEVVVQMSKFCPFNERECNREGCRLWSGQFDACGVAVNHLALVQVAEALQDVAAFMSFTEKGTGYFSGTRQHVGKDGQRQKEEDVAFVPPGSAPARPARAEK